MVQRGELRSMGSVVLLINLLGWWSVPLYAVYRVPQVYQDYKPASSPDEQLEQMTIVLNGLAQVVQAGETLYFIRGDKLVVTEARLRKRDKAIDDINIVGFVHPAKNHSYDDRGQEVDTSKELLDPEMMLDQDEGLYGVVASADNVLYGQIFLKPIAPHLNYIEVSVNGQARVVRPEELLVLKASDLFKVTAVSTNVKNHGEIQLRATYQSLVFSHRGYDFATISMRIDP